MKSLLVSVLVLMSMACSSTGSGVAGGSGGSSSGTTASVVGVAVDGAPGAYQFDVTLKSPDTGCDQYADWWEVVRPDGQLVFRRILGHSHVKEQPFTRSGGPVAIDPDDKVIVRAHMAGGAGYGGTAFSGSPSVGFSADESIGAGWQTELAKANPKPDGCAF